MILSLWSPSFRDEFLISNLVIHINNSEVSDAYITDETSPVFKHHLVKKNVTQKFFLQSQNNILYNDYMKNYDAIPVDPDSPNAKAIERLAEFYASRPKEEYHQPETDEQKLWYAVRQEKWNLVQDMLDGGVDVNYQNPYSKNRTIFHLACFTFNDVLANKILETGRCNPRIEDDDLRMGIEYFLGPDKHNVLATIKKLYPKDYYVMLEALDLEPKNPIKRFQQKHIAPILG